MKPNFTFLSFIKKITSFLTIALLLLGSPQLKAQVNATEDFEAEGPSGSGTAQAFSQSGISFISTSALKIAGASNTAYGANNSHYFLDANTSTSGQTVGSITIQNAATAFKINSFAAYVATDLTGNNQSSGNVTFVGNLATGGTATETVNITPSGSGNGVRSGIVFTGPLANAFITSISVTLSSSLHYIELDDIYFTTQAIVSNQFSINDVSLPEGNSGTKFFTFTVTRTNNTAASSVQVQSADGTATSPSDYLAFPLTTLNFPAGGALTQTVNVTVNGDATIEGDETFFMNLSNPTGGVILDGQGVGTILEDDEVTETFEDETPNAQTFSQSGFNFYSNKDLLISRGIAIGNGTGITTALDTRVGNGGSSGNVGTFGLTTTGISFNITKIDVWTSNNDGLTGTTSTVNVTFIGTKADGTGTVSYVAPIAAISGSNFQTINFSAVPAFANVQLIAISVTLGSGINYISLDNFKYGTASISATQLSINDVSVVEGTGGGTNTATFTVTRSNNTSAFSVNVASSDGTATAGSDYVAYPSTPINFTNGGPLTQTVSVTILKDATIEPNETFNMTLSGATNGVLYAKPIGIGTILDDDKIIETFDDETDNAIVFSENTVAYSATDRLKVHISQNSGSGFSTGYLTSGASSLNGSVGKISITSPNKAFKLIQLDAWTGNGSPTPTNVSGSVTFTGTLYGGGTVTATKTITSNTVNGWQQNITFTGTPLDNVLLTDLAFSVASPLTTVEIDNFSYAAFTTAPYLEVVDASNNTITNNGAASTTNNTDFGTACIGTPIAKTFIIKNTGFASLTLSGSPLAVVGGANANQFSVTTQPASSVAAAGTTAFTVTYTPTTAATHNATITLTSNDGLNSPFVINIKGTANAAVSVTTQPANQVISGNGTTGLGNAMFTVAASNATYQWQIKVGASYTNLTNTAPYSGVTTNTLTITNPPIALNNAIYRCVLSGTSPCSGVNSNDVTLSIVSPSATLPSGTLAGTDITTGTDAGWTFYAAGGNVGFAIQWGGNTAAKASAVVSTTNGPATSAIRNPPGAIYAMARYWNVTTSTALSTAVNIRFYYTSADKTGVTTSATTYATANSVSNDGFRWFKTVGSAYDPSNVTSNRITGNIIFLTGTETTINGVQQTEFASITSFSGGTGAASAGFAGTLLPIELLAFKAEKLNDGSVDLRWSTASEKSSAYFTLDRSTNGIDFTNIATIKSKGTTTDKQDYDFIDGNPNIGINYYRLSEVSTDGLITRFPLQTITIAGNQMVKIYPNPIMQGRSFYVTVNAAAAITVKTITGQLLDVSFNKISNSLYEVKTNTAFTAGIYLVTIKTASGEENTQRLMVQ